MQRSKSQIRHALAPFAGLAVIVFGLVVLYRVVFEAAVNLHGIFHDLILRLSRVFGAGDIGSVVAIFVSLVILLIGFMVLCAVSRSITLAVRGD